MKHSETKLIRQQLAQIHRAEKRLMRYRAQGQNREETGGLRSKIPPKVLAALESAFEKGFIYIFDKGTPLIEKSGNLAKVRGDASANYYMLREEITKVTLGAFDQSANNKSWENKGITTFEGAALGVFGIGLPAIPVFLGVVFKTIYEIAASYGFDYTTPGERAYILHLIRIAAANGTERIMESNDCDRLGERLDQEGESVTELDPEDIKSTAKKLASSTLIAKFVQGITLVGVLGAGFNYYWVHRISRIARMKYKKRFLFRLYQNRD